MLSAIHTELNEELFKFAGPKNRTKAESWLKNKRTEMKGSSHLLKKFLKETPEAERELAEKHINPKSFEMISVINSGETVKFLIGSPIHEGGRSSDETQETVELTIPFLAQATDTTQAQWWNVFGDNPSHFKEPETTIKINGIEVDPNRPVESISWWSAVSYCNERSRKEGLESVYDFSGIKFTGNAKDGTLDGTGEVIINKKAKGYRLPTEAEWEYMARAGTTTSFFFGDNQEELSQYAYYNKNSDGKTHPVGLLKPNDLGLYDMQGNVYQWTENRYAKEISGGTDPTGSHSGFDRVIRGGSWRGSPEYLRSAYRGHIGPSNRDSGVGFRVVRRP